MLLLDDVVTRSSEILEMGSPSLFDTTYTCAIQDGWFMIYCCMFQGFNWESPKRYPWWTYLQSKVEELVELGVTDLWLPPACQSVDKNGNTFNCFFIRLKNFASIKKVQM